MYNFWLYHLYVFSAEIVQDSDGEESDAINFDPSLPAQHQVKWVTLKYLRKLPHLFLFSQNHNLPSAVMTFGLHKYLKL